jgi:hypothetical protein
MGPVATPDTQEVMMDATIVRSHVCASGYGKNSRDQEALGQSKGEYTTKLHALIDALGHPTLYLSQDREMISLRQKQ